jgi:ribonucleoside-diphosphate reductase beta chain
MIVGLYKAIQKDDEISLFKAMVASVYLESFLFYSIALNSEISSSF